MRKDFKIVEKSKLWYSISAGVVILGLIFMLIFSGLNLGIDFTGGSTIEVSAGSYITLNDTNKQLVTDVCTEYFIDNQMTVRNIQSTETDDIGALEFKFQQEINGEDVTLVVFNEKMNAMKIGLLDKLNTSFSENIEYGTVDFTVNTYTITSTASSELIKNTFIAVGVAVILILAYIAIRFTWASGFAAVIALIHDTLIMLSLTIIFQIQVNASFIAAIITIIGYSINATIIVFDKVRENSKSSIYADDDYKGIMNASITQTFNRTVFSSITTMLTITMLAIFGVPAIREFAIPIIFGLISGTYSSFVMSGSLWVGFQKIAVKARNSDRYKAKKAAKKREAEKA